MAASRLPIMLPGDGWRYDAPVRGYFRLVTGRRRKNPPKTPPIPGARYVELSPGSWAEVISRRQAERYFRLRIIPRKHRYSKRKGYLVGPRFDKYRVAADYDGVLPATAAEIAWAIEHLTGPLIIAAYALWYTGQGRFDWFGTVALHEGADASIQRVQREQQANAPSMVGERAWRAKALDTMGVAPPALTRLLTYPGFPRTEQWMADDIMQSDRAILLALTFEISEATR